MHATPDAAGQRTGIPALVAIAVVVLLLRSAVPLTQSDGDLFAHIAEGRITLQRGIPLAVSPAWGSAVIFACLHALGGLTGIAVFVAVLAGITHALTAILWERAGVRPMAVAVAAALSVTLTASHWLARPHAFSLLGASLLMVLLVHRRARLLPWLVPLFAVWANLHGGWSYGLLLLWGATAGELFGGSRNRRNGSADGAMYAQRLLIMSVAASVATLITPYGLRLHATVWHTLADPTLARVIQEHQPPSPANPVDALFMIIALAIVPALVMMRRSLSPSAGAIVILSVLAAAKTGRNISLFALTGWPLLVLAFAPRAPSSAAGEPVAVWSARVMPHLAVSLCLTVLAVGTVGHRLLPPFTPALAVDPARFPVLAIQHLRRGPAPEPLLTTWTWSGYVPYAWEGHHALFTPLRFSAAEVHLLGTLLLTRPGWRTVLDSVPVNTVLLPRAVPLADSLSHTAGWRPWYADDTAVILRR